MTKSKKLRAHKSRRTTDEQIHVLQSWVPFRLVARSMGLSVEYARRLRAGKIQFKTRSP